VAGDADGAAERVDGRPRCGSEQCPAAVLLDLDFAQVGEVVDDALPFERFLSAGGQAVDQFLSQHERKEGNEDVAADGGVGLVEDGAGGEQCLGGLEGVLHRQEVAVAEDHLQRGQPGVGAEHEQAVETGVRLDLGRIDGEPLALGCAEEATKAGVANQGLVALGELTFESDEDGGPGLGILVRLLFVAAQHVAPRGDGNVLDGELGLALLAGHDERHRHAVVVDDVGPHGRSVRARRGCNRCRAPPDRRWWPPRSCRGRRRCRPA
jgi:hypothetical protein